MSPPPDVADVVRAGYGKLPSSREYIRLDCDRGPARWFRDYLDRAAVLLDLEPDPQRAPFRAAGMVPGADVVVAASVWPSADEGGRRRFPFSVYHLLTLNGMSARASCFWSGLEGLAEEQARLFADAWALDEANGFERRFGGDARPPVGAQPEAEAVRRQRQAAEAVPLAQWFDDLFAEQGEQVGPMVFWRLRHVLRAAAGSLASLAPDCPGLKLPLSPRWGLAVQADAWLTLLAGSEGQLTCPPQMLLGDMGARPGLAVMFRALEPRDAGLFTGRSVRGMVDLSQHREPADQNGFGAFASQIRRRVDTPQATLAALSTLLEETDP